jgi:hypothetical protein
MSFIKALFKEAESAVEDHGSLSYSHPGPTKNQNSAGTVQVCSISLLLGLLL